MPRRIYRFTFQARIPTEEIESALLLALFATESLHGRVQVQLKAAHFFDRANRVCIVDGRSRVGEDFSKLFAGMLLRQFGLDAFKISRNSKSSCERKQDANEFESHG